jgi:poly-gamma-glutamate synthesis protein (capsule biosynthesis protein)
MLFHAGLWKPAAIPTDAQGRNYDFMPLLQGQSAYLNKADIAICHQETPFAQVGEAPQGYPIFNTPWELAVTEKALGYDACDTVSNHTVDMGYAGVVRTLDVLDQNGLKHTGSYRTPEEAEEILIMDTPAGKVAFIAATFSLNGNFSEFDWQADYPLDADRMIAKAAKARELGADVVIGVQHAGTEYSSEADIQQINNAHALIDSGQFDMVYGHHPHSIQPMEFYNGKWIVYSLGNGISESSGDYPVNNEFLIMRAQFSKAKDGTWSVSDMAWAAATNKQEGVYRWCSVASDAPQGICQSPEFDAGVRERTRATVNAMGAEVAGAHEWLVTQDK